jgi:hypothetical protein
MAYNKHLDELNQWYMIIKDRVRGVVHGESAGMYLHGRPGTSKTYTVCTTLENLGASFHLTSGHVTPMGLFDLLRDNRTRTLVLDDVSAIFNSAISLQLLLAAVGTPHTGSRVRRVTHQTARGEASINYEGAIIALSNLPMHGHHQEVLAALRDRIHVMAFDPSDEHIIAQILDTATSGPRNVSPEDATMVATFLVTECKSLGCRPTMRLFMDKALRDFRQWSAGQSEANWRDLVVSTLREETIRLQHETRDLSKVEKKAGDLRRVLNICLQYATNDERVQAWVNATGKSQATFYRRLADLKQSNQLPKVLKERFEKGCIIDAQFLDDQSDDDDDGGDTCGSAIAL